MARCWTQIEGGLPCLDAIKLGQAALAPWDPWDGPREVFREPYDFDGPTGYAAAESVGDGCPNWSQSFSAIFAASFVSLTGLPLQVHQ